MLGLSYQTRLGADMDIVGGLAATSNAISLVKALRDADSALDTATLKAKLAEVMGELTDAKLAQLELLEKNAELEKEVRRLVAVESDIAELTELDGYRYRKNAEGQVMGWPACPSCLNKEKSVALLVQDGHIEHAACPRCHTKFFPVTSFVAPGLTRAEEKRQERARAQEEQNRALRNQRSSWMG
jgi:PIN domain nuclease of toxin-antitoxin system